MVSILPRKIPRSSIEPFPRMDFEPMTEQREFMDMPPWKMPQSYGVGSYDSRSYNPIAPPYKTQNLLGLPGYSPREPYIPAPPDQLLAHGNILIVPVELATYLNAVEEALVSDAATTGMRMPYKPLDHHPSGNTFNVPETYKMPALSINIPEDEQLKPYIKNAILSVKQNEDVYADLIGILPHKRRYDGVVPVQMDETEAYVGVTELNPMTGRAKRVGISSYTDPARARNGGAHEGVHVLTGVLLPYTLDSPEPVGRTYMEMLAEYSRILYARHIGDSAMEAEIMRLTPYATQIALGDIIEERYVSEMTGKRGFRAFNVDVQLMQSLEYARERLHECMEPVLKG